MLWSKFTRHPIIKTGDLVQFYVKEEKEKWGKQLFSRVFLSIDNYSGIVSVPGLSVRTISVAVEDVLLTIVDDELPGHISATNNQLETSIDDAVETLPEANVNVLSEINVSAPDFNHDGETITGPSVSLQKLVDRLEVFWPLNDQYYSGVVSSFTEDGQHFIGYGDGDLETLDISNEKWRSTESVHAN